MTKKQREFIERVGVLAAADMAKSGVLASLAIAQAILESGWGESGLAVKANALFGIKANKSWKGAVYNTKTRECYDGVTFTEITALFRAYDSWEESVADHSMLLLGAKRYKAVVGERNYKTACRAIQRAGYATDPTYADKLIEIIEAYNLTAYDGIVKGESTKMTEKERKNRENLVSIARSYLGCKESDGSHKKIVDAYNAHKPLPRGYPMRYTDAWCACFVTVVSIEAGMTASMPKECGCAKMVELYKKLGRWQERDDYVPSPGDVIFYDWEDSGKGDNKGAPNHVGIVDAVTDSAMRVIEGNINNAVGYRDVTVNGRYIRGYGLPDYSNVTIAAPTDKPSQPTAMRVGARVKYSGTVYRSSDGTGKGKTVNGTFTVKYYYKGRKCGVHIDGLGWVAEGDCTIVG